MELKAIFLLLFMFSFLHAKPMNTIADYVDDEEKKIEEEKKVDRGKEKVDREKEKVDRAKEKVEEEEGDLTAMDRILVVNGLTFKHTDMIYTPQQEKAEAEAQNGVQRDLVRNLASLWPKSGSSVNVPYTISSANAQGRAAISAAIDEFRRKTCINLIPRTNQKDYIRIIAGGGCYSYVGRIGGRQDLSLGRGCEYKSTAVHEFMHAIGYFHEQSRPDRDSFIRINTENIINGFASQFRELQTNNQGTPYDYVSVMHYGPYAFSKSYGRLTTIERKTGNPADRLKLGNRNGLSFYDAKSINLAYCGGTGTTTTTKKPSTGIDSKKVRYWASVLQKLTNWMNNALKAGK